MDVLIVKLGAIGDVVMALPMIAAARSLASEVRITWLCGRVVAPLLERIEGIDRLIVIDEARLLRGTAMQRVAGVLEAWRRLGRRHYDLAVMAHPDPRYRLLLRSIRSPLMRAATRSGRPNPLPGRHHSFEYVRLITGRDGPDSMVFPMPAFAAPSIPALSGRIAALGTGPVIVMAPGGARNIAAEQPWRRWPVDRYAAAARHLIAEGCRIVLIGSDTDAYARPAFAGLPVADLIGVTDLCQMTAVLAEADLVLSHDTGALHLARLVDRPVLGLFGPTLPDEKLYPSPISRYIWGGSQLPCRPCYDGNHFHDCADNRCMTSIEPDAVAAEVLSMLVRGEKREKIDCVLTEK